MTDKQKNGKPENPGHEPGKNSGHDPEKSPGHDRDGEKHHKPPVIDPRRFG